MKGSKPQDTIKKMLKVYDTPEKANTALLEDYNRFRTLKLSVVINQAESTLSVLTQCVRNGWQTWRFLYRTPTIKPDELKGINIDNMFIDEHTKLSNELDEFIATRLSPPPTNRDKKMIRIINYKKKFPQLIGVSTFNRWLSIDTFYSCRVIHINIKHFTIEIDFRPKV